MSKPKKFIHYNVSYWTDASVEDSNLVLVPNYLAQFGCIGPECEDSCCKGFGTVHIDEETFHRYQTYSDRSGGLPILQSIDLEADPNEAYFARIKKQHDGSCPFWRADKLCELQAAYGEEALSFTCLTYPRITNLVGGFREQSLSLTCPEAARVVLCPKSPITFSEKSMPVTRFEGLFTKNLQFDSNGYTPEGFRAIRQLATSVLQMRSLRLWQRLALVCVAFEQIEAASSMQVGTDRVVELARAFLESCEVLDVREELIALVPQPQQMFQLYLNLLTAGLVYDGVGERYEECVLHSNAGLGITQNIPYQGDPERFRAAVRVSFREFEDKHGTMLEHYLVNSVFQTLFPMGMSVGLLAELQLLLLKYAVLRVQIAGLVEFHGESSQSNHVKLFQSFAKGFDHNDSGLRALLEFLRMQGYSTPAQLVGLVCDEE